MRQGASGASSGAPQGKASGSSFLDEWLAKRQQLGGGAPRSSFAAPPAPIGVATPASSDPRRQPQSTPLPPAAPTSQSTSQSLPAEAQPPMTSGIFSGSEKKKHSEEKLHLRGDNASSDGEVSVKLRKED